MAYLSLHDINQLDLVDFLSSLGYQPATVKGDSYWYLSPLPGRSENTPSFKVNRKINCWWDFGTGEGSTLADFAIRYYDCTIHDLREKLSGPSTTIRDVPPHHSIRHKNAGKVLTVLNTFPIRSYHLLRYLWERRIPIGVAQKYCVEAQYTFGPKAYYAVGFPCDAGGYELRNRYHKYSTSPKSPTLISRQSKDLAIFEGFFNMLTYITFSDLPDKDLPDLLVLNSAPFFESYTPLMDSYRQKHLFLDNDPTGDKYTKMALDKRCGYIDHRPLYKAYNDLNQWACSIGTATPPPLPG